jgi:hypothetical protein
MIINGALLLLVRSVSMALLAMVGGQWLLVYLVSDMGLYFAYKILRRDLWHWVPLQGAASVVQSVLERLVVKVLVDFTGVIQFRAAGEMGGSYFTFNMVRARFRHRLPFPLLILLHTHADHGARRLVRRHPRLLYESRAGGGRSHGRVRHMDDRGLSERRLAQFFCRLPASHEAIEIEHLLLDSYWTRED